jgi:hypothetical protein
MRRVDFASYLPAPPHLFGSVQQDLTQSNEYDEPYDRREEYAREELSINHNGAICNSTPLVQRDVLGRPPILAAENCNLTEAQSKSATLAGGERD